MGDEEHRPPFPGAALQQVVEQIAAGGVEAGVGLVEQEKPGTAGQRHRQARPTLLPGRKSTEGHTGQPAEAQLLDHSVGIGRLAAPGPDPEADVLPDGEVVVGTGGVAHEGHIGADGVPVGGEVVAQHDGRAGRQLETPGQEPQQRRLPRTVGPGDEHDLALGDVEVDAGQRRISAEKADGGAQVDGGRGQIVSI